LKELLRTNDPVRLSYLTAVLEEAGIPCVVFDAHTANIEGSLGMLPRRLMVPDDDLAEALEMLRSIDAG
jgi:hypothetical protein